MADFVDDRADEEPEAKAEEHQEEGADDGLPSDEEEASDGSGSDDEDSSEEGDDDEDAFENDGFIVDEAEDEGEAGEEEGGGSDVEGAAEAKKRRKKKRRRELVLDEEDYELLEDNTGIRRQRPQQQHRRIKKARDSATGATAAQDAARALQEELFGLEDNELEDDDEDAGPAGGGAAGGARPRKAQAGGRDEAPLPEADDQFDDDEDDWLVHEDEEEGGAPPGQRRRRRRAAMEGMPGIDPDALAEADEIFGNVDDLLSMYEDRRRAVRGGELGADEEEDLAEEELEGMDEEEAERRHREREERRAAAAARRVQEQVDPEAMARHYMLPRDEQIREVDLPEREQLHRGPDPTAADLAACAQWVWAHLVGERRRGLRVEDVLEDGVREVEGPPPAWYGREQWRLGDLKEDLVNIGSYRALYLGRDSSGLKREWRHNAGAQEDLRRCIEAVLRQIYDKHEEVPFIAQYRKELCGELLAVRSSDEPKTTTREDGAGFPSGVILARHRAMRRYEVMFAVQQLAQRWRALQVRREVRQRAYERALDETMHSEEQAAIRACLDLLQQAESMEEMDDVEAKFRLATQQFAPEDAMSQLSLGGAAGARRPQKTTSYLLCLRAGLAGFAAGFGLTAGQLAENVEAGYKKHIPVDLQVTPQQHAEQFIAASGGFSSVESVLKGGCHMAAVEIAAEPLVRQEVRKQYWETAVVSTAPTPAGESALDPFHQLAPVKRLAFKPLSKFEGSDQFLRLLRAEKEGLIKVTFGFKKLKAKEQEDQEDQWVEENAGEELVASLAEWYLSGGLSEAAQAWDEKRRAVLAEAVKDMLLPLMEREARARLATGARSAALEEAGDKLWAHASQPPLQVKLVDEDELEPDRRVMAVCYGTGNPATTFVMLDPAGNLVDFLHCPQFSGPIPRRKALPGVVYSMYDDPKKGQDAARIRSFIEDHKPHAIVVGASHPEARTLEEDLGSIRESILLDNPRFQIELGTGDLQILMADESVAAVWENSAAAKEELAGAAAAPIVRRAVALGRLMLDPLALLASLCTGGKEVLALHLHPLQAQLTEEERLGMVERVMTSAVSQVGIDLNAVAASTWQSAPLQFVPGLGPRKAAALLRAIMRAGGFVESRQQVWRELGVFGNRVFRNAAPYLRIRASAKGTANLDMDPLDDTRIHPEHYKYAQQMAASATATALGNDEGEEAAAVENAFTHPQEVERLDLVFYDDHLRKEEATPGAPAPPSRLATLIDIQMEFVAPYGELRGELQALKPEHKFWLCSGETKDTLKRGRKVEARVRYVGEMDARCVLPDLNNLEAVIERKEVSKSAGEDINVRDFLQSNQTVSARIIEVQPEYGLIKLSTRSDTLNNDLVWEQEYLSDRDKYYCLPTKEEIRAAVELRRQGPRAGKFVARPIQHPLFKNISMVDAASQLQEEGVEVGQALFRPSGRSTKIICLTMKLPDSIWHLDLDEQGKSAASLKLGSSLVLEYCPGSKREAYEDLDEVTARFVEPVQDNLRKLLKHRKWKALPWEQAKEHLLAEKQAMPAKAPYCLGPDEAHAGTFYLGYVLSTTPRREYFMVTPEGYYFRKKDYPTVDHMLKAFMKNPRPPMVQAPPPPPQQQVPQQPQQRQQQQQQPPAPPSMMSGQGMPPQGGGGGGGWQGPPQPAYGYGQQQPMPMYPGGGGGGPGGYGGGMPPAAGGPGGYWHEPAYGGQQGFGQQAAFQQQQQQQGFGPQQGFPPQGFMPPPQGRFGGGGGPPPYRR